MFLLLICYFLTLKVQFLEAESEGAKARLQEVASQYQSEKEALLRHSDGDKTELSEKLQNAQGQLDEELQKIQLLQTSLEETQATQEQLQQLQATSEQLVVQLQGEIEDVKKNRDELTQQLQNIGEKHEQELQEKLKVETVLTEKVQELEGAIATLQEQVKNAEQVSTTSRDELDKQLIEIKDTYESRIQEQEKEYEEKLVKLKEEYERLLMETKNESDQVLKEKLEILEGNDNELKEHKATVEKSQAEIKLLNEKFAALKERAKGKIDQLQAQLENKERDMNDIKEEHAVARENSEKEKDEYEARIREMESHDSELNTKLEQLQQELSKTEDKLQVSVCGFIFKTLLPSKASSH